MGARLGRRSRSLSPGRREAPGRSVAAGRGAPTYPAPGLLPRSHPTTPWHCNDLAVVVETLRTQRPPEGEANGGRHLRDGRDSGHAKRDGAGRPPERRRGGAGAHADAGTRHGPERAGPGGAPARPRGAARHDPPGRGHGRVRLRHCAVVGRHHRDVAARRARHDGLHPDGARELRRRPGRRDGVRPCGGAASTACPLPWADASHGGRARHLANGGSTGDGAGRKRRDVLSPGDRCGRATTRAHPPRRGWAGRARRTTGGSTRSRRPVPGRR